MPWNICEKTIVIQVTVSISNMLCQDNIQDLMDDQNINSEIVDYYINMLQAKMQDPTKTNYYGKKHLILSTNAYVINENS